MTDRTPELDAEFDANAAEFDRLSAELTRLEAAERINGVLAAPSPRNVKPTPVPGFASTTGSPRAGSWSGTGAPMAYATPGASNPEVRASIAALGDYVKTGRIAAAMTIGGASGAEGGYTVTTEVDRELLSVYATQSPLFALARRRDGVTSGFRFPIATTLPTVGWVAETGTRSVTATPTFAEVLPPNAGVYAVASLTQWLLQDSEYELGSFVLQEIGRAQGQAIGDKLINGNGSGAPKGVLAYTFNTTADGSRTFGDIQYVPGGVSASLNIDAAISAFYALKPEYQGSSAWIMSPGAAEVLRKQKSSSGGDYMWVEAREGQPATLIGRPVHVDVNMPAVSGTNIVALLGDWQRAYGVTLLGEAIMLRDPYTSKGSVLVYSERRVGGAVLDSNAVKAIKCGTT